MRTTDTDQLPDPSATAASDVAVRMHVVPEVWVSVEERRQLGEALPEAWRDQYRGSSVRGWTQRQPGWRLIITAGGRLVAQASLVVLTPDLLGLADVVVHERWRGAGLGSALVDAAVWFTAHHGVSLAADTQVPELRGALVRRGARPPAAGELCLAGGAVPPGWLLVQGDAPAAGIVLDSGF